jgi:SOS-response transcriptional repressors (RecA-mediated autopeptidases)
MCTDLDFAKGVSMLSKNLKYLRLKNGFSQEDVAKIADKKSFTTVQKWESGVAEPPIGVASKLAEIYGVSLDALYNTDLACVTGAQPRRKGIKIPVLGRVVAGVPVDAVEEILDYEEITPELAATGNFFALQIRGHSMEPRMLDGDVVIVRQQSDVDSGDTAIILVNGDDATVKRISKSDKGITLIATNPNVYEPHFYTNEEIESLPIQILGKVVELRGKF